MNKMKRVNIGLKDDMHAQAKIIAILKRVSMSQYLESCIEEAMNADRKLLENLKIKNGTKK